MADKIVVLNGGRIEQVGTPMELYNKPATPFVAGFIGSPKMNLFTGDIARAKGCTTYGIRPEHLTISKTDGEWRGTLRHIERLGADAILHLDVPDLGQVVARAAGDTDVSPGATVWATPAPGKEVFFH